MSKRLNRLKYEFGDASDFFFSDFDGRERMNSEYLSMMQPTNSLPIGGRVVAQPMQTAKVRQDGRKFRVD